jgi:hypothetical protein
MLNVETLPLNVFMTLKHVHVFKDKGDRRKSFTESLTERYEVKALIKPIGRPNKDGK